MPREAPLDFFKEKNKQQYFLINLIILEASYVYMAQAESGSSTTKYVVSDSVKDTLVDSAYDFTEGADGYCWMLVFESGANVGAMRKITGWNSTTNTFTFSIPLDNDPSTDGDLVRIAKHLFLAGTMGTVSFYIPDDSYGADVPMVYLPFPLSITPMGTDSKGEVLTLDVSVSSVDKSISNAIQLAGGLQGNRVYHLRVFNGALDQGKEYCIKDVAHIDSVSLDNQEIKFTLESRFNIVDIQLPQSSYTRDFCRFRFKSDECGWSESRTNPYFERKDILGNVIYSFPLVSADSCDHTQNGPNGCLAHNNTLRFGGFPGINVN